MSSAVAAGADARPVPTARDRLHRDRLHRGSRPRLPSVGLAVVRFVAAGTLVLLVLAVASSVVLRRTGTHEAVRDATVLAELDARAVVVPALTPALAAGDPVALGAFDDLVRRRVLVDPVVRVKLWDPSGTVVYSDDARLVGARFHLDGEAAEVLARGGTAADLSDLSAPENRFEGPQHQLLEVYQRLVAPDGSVLLFEMYLRFSSVTASGAEIWRSFAPVFLGALVLLQLLQAPLAWSMARQLRQRQREREELLTRALHASDVERRRIARDVHDGAVQTLSGVAYALAGIQSRLRLPEQRDEQRVLAGAVTDTRRGISELRSLLVEIYPPSLVRGGLAPALEDLASTLRSRGVRTTVQVDDDLALGVDRERLVYRVAQEAVRNVARHARAARAVVSVTADGAAGCALEVSDDGVGFEPDPRDGPARGHFGLTMAAELAAELGGRLQVVSRPGATRVRLDLP